ncbi:MAG: P1 family peptidase [Acidobacteriota bacterium]
MKGLTDIDGILVGHASPRDSLTGCTAILCEAGAVGGIDIRGSATGSTEWQVLAPDHVTDRVHAICLAGGSAFGLEAASGVRNFLARKGVGFPTRAGVVPLVPGAILFDLALAKKGVLPNRELGEAAAKAATNEAVAEGNVGAGTGASVGKLFGMNRAMKAGIGSSTVWLDGPFAGVRVSALAAVNAFGDVLDPESGHILAGARTAPTSRDFADTAASMIRGAHRAATRDQQGQNTTLAVVATNARLNKVQATKLAQMANAGFARAIAPAWTTFDGDVTFALSLGTVECDLVALGAAAAQALTQSIVRAVQLAAPLGGLPGLLINR